MEIQLLLFMLIDIQYLSTLICLGYLFMLIRLQSINIDITPISISRNTNLISIHVDI